MRAILIDPEHKTLTEVTVGPSTLESMYQLLNCTIIEIPFILPTLDVVVVDEEGLLKKPLNETHWFGLPSITPTPIQGKALITSELDRDAVTTILQAQEVVHFYSHDQAREAFAYSERVAKAYFEKLLAKTNKKVFAVNASFNPFTEGK